MAEYGDESTSAFFRGYDATVEATSKTITLGQEVAITVSDLDQNHDKGAKEQVKVEIDPEGLSSEFFATLEETGVDTGVFSKKLIVGQDFAVEKAGGEFVDSVLVRYVDAVTLNGDELEDRELTLSFPIGNAKLAVKPSDSIGPQARITITVTDVDYNSDPKAVDFIDDDNALEIITDNGEISDDEIRLGDDGLLHVPVIRVHGD